MCVCERERERERSLVALRVRFTVIWGGVKSRLLIVSVYDTHEVDTLGRS